MTNLEVFLLIAVLLILIGGGKPFFVQGSVQATEDEIRNFFEK